MTMARPDTSRRREPSCPGRRFGTDAPRTTSRSSRVTPAATAIALLALPFGAALPIGAALANDDAGPIVLSNADVARLHAGQKQAQPASAAPAPAPAAPAPAPAAPAPGAAASTAPGAAPSTARGAAASTAPTDAEIEAEQRHIEADLRRQLDRISRQSMGAVTRRLDQLDLPEMPDVSASPDASLPAAPAPGDAPKSPSTSTKPGPRESSPSREEPHAQRVEPHDPSPACIYGVRGRLIHAPRGMSCAPVREVRAARAIDTDSMPGGWRLSTLGS